MDHQGIVQWVGNIFSIGAIWAAFVGVAPAAGALVALIWYTIQIKESETAKRWFASRRTRKIARLKARLVKLEADDLSDCGD